MPRIIGVGVCDFAGITVEGASADTAPRNCFDGLAACQINDLTNRWLNKPCSALLLKA